MRKICAERYDLPLSFYLFRIPVDEHSHKQLYDERTQSFILYDGEGHHENTIIHAIIKYNELYSY